MLPPAAGPRGVSLKMKGKCCFFSPQCLRPRHTCDDNHYNSTTSRVILLNYSIAEMYFLFYLSHPFIVSKPDILLRKNEGKGDSFPPFRIDPFNSLGFYNNGLKYSTFFPSTVVNVLCPCSVQGTILPPTSCDCTCLVLCPRNNSNCSLIVYGGRKKKKIF